jgi:hypothetical protein
MRTRLGAEEKDNPIPSFLWHDVLTFGRKVGWPDYETTVDGTTWVDANDKRSTYDPLLTGKEGLSVYVVPSNDPIIGWRAIWKAGVAWSNLERWIIGFAYSGTAQIKDIVLESSSDQGVTWTERFRDNGNSSNARPYAFKHGQVGGDGYLRLTFLTDGTSPVRLSGIRALTQRWGDQGGGIEYTLPYGWDADRKMYIERLQLSADSGGNPFAAGDLLTAASSYGDVVATKAEPGNIPDTVVKRNANGQIAVGDPTSDGHAVTRKFVTDNLASKVDTADSRLTDARTPLAHVHPVTDISPTTGTRSATTFLRGDGAWITPTNTTYSALTLAEAQTGTATTTRAITAAVLKQSILHYVTGSSTTALTAFGQSLTTAADAAAARTLLGVVSDFVSVKTYGAVGNGSTNDTTAFANAMTAARAAKKPLYIPGGTYSITAFPTLQNGDVIIGDGGRLSEILFAGAGALVGATGIQNVRVEGVGVYLTNGTGVAFDLSGCFAWSFVSVLLRGNHTSATGTTYQGQKGIVFRDNTGGCRIIDSNINNLGYGIQTSCIQNHITQTKFSSCRYSIHGTGNNSNAGLSLSQVEFDSAKDATTTPAHVWIDGAANEWNFYQCWFEGGNKALQVGLAGTGGPSKFTMSGCKIAARTVGLELNHCRQPHLENSVFDLDQGSVAGYAELTINGTYCGEGVADNLITTVRGDFAESDFPQYWTVHRKGWLTGGNVKARSVMYAASHFEAPDIKLTHSGAEGNVLRRDANGYAIWSPVPAGDWSTLTNKPSTFAPSSHTHVATDISNSTATGRSVLTAADAAAARTAIGAASAATALTLGLTSTTAKPGDWTPALGEITGLQTALDGKATKATGTPGTGQPWASEVIVIGGPLENGYNDAIGGVMADRDISLESVVFRTADPTKAITGTGNLTIQWYRGSVTTLESELLHTSTIAAGAGNNSIFVVLATPINIAVNECLRAKFTLGTAVVDSAVHVQWRGMYR